MRYTFTFFMLYLPETTNTLLFMETMIGPGKVRRGVPFQAMKESFSIGETASGYTLYKSVSCESAKAGKQAWDAAQGDVPSGWKVCSDPIPADTQHNVYDVVPGEWFFLMGVTDNEINVRNLI